MWNPFDLYTIPLGDWVEAVVGWLVMNFRIYFQAIRWPISQTLDGVEATLQSIPPVILLIILFFILLLIAKWRIALFSVLTLVMIGFLGTWEEAMTTLSIVITAVLFCIIIGTPLGILSARNNTFEVILRPVLDAMQTTPSFVYLVPIVMLFGIGNVPGIIVTIIYALPPIIRFTNLGIRQVPKEVMEAAYSFGSTPRQALWNIQLPLALRTIMAGLNQTLMMALSMVVIASMIAVPGLGLTVLRGIGRLDIGLAAIGGLSIVLLAIMLDRITQAIGKQASSNNRMQNRRIWRSFVSRITHLWKSPVSQIETPATNKITGSGESHF